MAAKNETNWTVTGITSATWTTLVGNFQNLDKAIRLNRVQGVSLTTSTDTVDVEIRIVDSAGAAVATLLPTTTLAAGETVAIPETEGGMIVLKNGQELEVYASSTEAEFFASGAY